MNDEGFELTISRIIRAPRSAIWTAWTDPKHFEKWWIPEPIECKVMAMDLRPGGAFETQMREEDAGEYQPHVKGCFLEVVTEEKIVFTTALTEGWRPADDPWLAMTAIITMQDDGDATKYEARVLHKNEADSVRHAEMGFEDGWGTVIEQLSRLVEQ